MAESINPTINVTKKKVPHTFTENGTYNVPSGLSYDPVTVAVEGGWTGPVDEELIITENGTTWLEDGVRANPIITEVPVPEDATKTITENGRYEAPDLVRWKSVIVNVEGGGSSYPSPFYILDPVQMDAIAAVAPHMPTSYTDYLYKTASVCFAPYVAKFNRPSDSRNGVVWSAYQTTFGGVANTAVFGRGGYDNAGIIFTQKIPGGIYSRMHLLYEITQGAFNNPNYWIHLTSAISFGSGMDPALYLYSEHIEGLIPETEKIIDVSGITDDFYVAFAGYNGFFKIRGLWFEIEQEAST